MSAYTEYVFGALILLQSQIMSTRMHLDANAGLYWNAQATQSKVKTVMQAQSQVINKTDLTRQRPNCKKLQNNNNNKNL